MRKQFDLEKLVQEVMSVQRTTQEEIDEPAKQIVDGLQQYVNLIQQHLRGEISRKEAESQIVVIWNEMKQIQSEQQYWWLPVEIK
jgi:hemerythrin-like domain-containing protein